MKILLGKQFQPPPWSPRLLQLKWHRECERPSWEPLLSDVGRKPQECGTMWGGPPMSAPPPPPSFSPGCSWKRHNAGAWEPSARHQPRSRSLKPGIFLGLANEDGLTRPSVHAQVFQGLHCVSLMQLWAFICLRNVLREPQTCAVESDAAWEPRWEMYF